MRSHQGRSAFFESLLAPFIAAAMKIINVAHVRAPVGIDGSANHEHSVNRRARDPAASCRESNAGPTGKVLDKSLQGLNRRSCVLSICHGCCLQHVTLQVYIARELETFVRAPKATGIGRLSRSSARQRRRRRRRPR